MNAVATPVAAAPPTGLISSPEDGEVLHAYGDRLRVVLPSSATGDSVCILEDETPAGNGPPPHVHHRDTEIFFVQSGRYEFFIDGRRSEVGPGTLLYGPPGVPHYFRALTDGCRMQITFLPGGFDRFMIESAELFAAGPPAPEDLVALGGKYGIEFLPPAAE